MHLSGILALLGAHLVVAAAEAVVALPYITLHGSTSNATNVTFYSRIPFARPPERFRAPQPPLDVRGAGIYDAARPFDMCPQRASNGSEDCLYLGVYGRPWQHGQEKRPVMVHFHGGGFIQGDANLRVPTPQAYPVLDLAADGFVAVFANYRVNAFGFLPGKRVKEGADLNVGLLDQRAALEWVRSYIDRFGGDPGDVTIWGQSAGGGSVVSHLIADGGKTTPQLFRRAILSSPFWPRHYRYDSAEAEELFDRLAELAGCSGGGDPLECLKQAPVQTILDANVVINTLRANTTSSYAWAPVIDDAFLPLSLSEAARRGAINGDAVLAVYNTYEGTTFIPGSVTTEDETREWVKGFLPGFDEAALLRVERWYPPSASVSARDRAGFIYRDVVLSCPAFWLAAGAKSGWLGEYQISPARHASDVGYWNSVSSIQTTSPITYRGYAGAFAGFITKGDPNAISGVTWPPVKKGKGRGMVINLEQFGTQSLTGLREKCDFWRAMGEHVPV